MTANEKAPKHITAIRKIFSFLFDLLYNQFAWTYDAVAWIVSGGLWKNWVLAVTPYLRDDNILELGFGPGHLQKDGLSQNKNLFGMDVSSNMVKKCRSKLSHANLSFNLIQANAPYLPFKGNSFDQVIATFPAPYIFSKQTLSAIFALLKPDGEMLVIPTAWSTSKSPIQLFFSWLFNWSAGRQNSHLTNLSAVLKPIEESGFKVSHQLLEVKKSKVLLISGRKPK